MARHRSSAVPLAWLYAGVVVYASLYPFTGWRLPGVGWLAWLGAPWPRWWTWFDVVANLAGYLPLGFLLYVGLLRGGRRPLASAALALALGALLALALEALQNALQDRIELGGTGIIAPCLVCYTIATPGWRRPALAVGAAAVGIAATTLSTALNFGPSHALAWLTPQTVQAVLVGLGAAALVALVPRRVAAGFGLIVLTALVMLVATAPADPYFAQSLRAWEQGRFIRFHGAAQWVGWLWPYAAMAFLLSRLASRESRP